MEIMTVEEFLEWQFLTLEKEKTERAFYAACHGVKLEDEMEWNAGSIGEFLGRFQ